MIRSREDYLNYLEEDRKMLGAPIFRWYHHFFIDEIWRFERTMRRCEYLTNVCGNSLWARFCRTVAYRNFKKQSIRLGFTIPPNTCGAGLRLVHYGCIIIHGKARIGEHCQINAGVNIGMQAGIDGAVPRIGNDVYIGPGAKLFGDIVIADGCAIGANAVVTHSCEQPRSVIIGIPARVCGTVQRKLF